MTTSHPRLVALWRGHRPLFAALVALRLVVGATWIAQAIAMASVFSILVNEGDPAGLVAPVALLLIALVTRPVVVLAGHAVAHRAMTAVKRDLRVRALGTLIRRSARDPRGRSGSDHAVVVDGIENLDSYLSAYLPQLVVTIITVAVVGTVMIALDPVAGIAAGLVAASVPLVPVLWSRLLARRGGDHWAAYQELQAEFVDSMQGMTTLVAFGAEHRREQQLAAASRSLLGRTIAQLRLSLLDSGLAALALVGAPALVVILLAVRAEPPSAIAAFTLVLLAIELVRPLRDLAALWHAGYLGTFSGAAILALLGDETAPSSPGSDDGGQTVDAIAVRDLVISHPDAASPALVVDDLRLAPGLTAIVGRTGAGKSTLAGALAGLVVPAAGSIALNGVAAGPEQLLRWVALVPQDPALFGGTIADEVSRGARPGATDVTSALLIAGIGTDDASLGPATAVGEGGALLSGGQRQRVAIARGLAQNRPVLILDEATSALDPASEAGLLTRLRAASPGILIAVTHRHAVARLADRVIVVDDGRAAAGDLPDEVRAAQVSA
ncbi:ABC transporter ATP-binding protein/permease [Pseudolysinimonas sp.]|jgi:ATP-binding cassette subfamily C protein CydD|uniref:ABC transporter ATP-binding protein/permease n=1 Tax=Pseudolysinimonas sp. TaxID=2680009 RepID=UPI00378407DD